jgi:hypothetical protein
MDLSQFCPSRVEAAENIDEVLMMTVSFLRNLRRVSFFLLSILFALVPCASLYAPSALAASATPPGSDQSWMAEVQQGLSEREYQASQNDQGIQAPNRRHNLRTYFEASGIRVHDRTAAGSPELLGLSLVKLGRGDALAPVGLGEVWSEGARVEIRRPHLVEWYENSAAGLEQGFTLSERPDGEGALTLELAVEHANASLRGERVILATSAGRQLDYKKLVVVDANGKEVAAHLEVPDSESTARLPRPRDRGQ